MKFACKIRLSTFLQKYHFRRFDAFGGRGVTNNFNRTLDKIIHPQTVTLKQGTYQHFNDFLWKYVCNHRRIGPFQEKFAKIIQIFLSTRSDPDPDKLFRIRMRPGQKVPGPKGSGYISMCSHGPIYYYICIAIMVGSILW